MDYSPPPLPSDGELVLQTADYISHLRKLSEILQLPKHVAPCVQHMVRISENDMSKGLVFGILDIAAREIIWLEMPFTSQTIRGCDNASVERLLKRLKGKITIGQLLQLKAQAQGLKIADDAEGADEAYTYEWALNTSAVNALL